MRQRLRRALVALVLFFLAGAVSVIGICALIACLPGYIHRGDIIAVVQDFWSIPGGGGKFLMISYLIGFGTHASGWYLRRTRRHRQMASHRVSE